MEYESSINSYCRVKSFDMVTIGCVMYKDFTRAFYRDGAVRSLEIPLIRQ